MRARAICVPTRVIYLAAVRAETLASLRARWDATRGQHRRLPRQAPPRPRAWRSHGHSVAPAHPGRARSTACADARACAPRARGPTRSRAVMSARAWARVAARARMANRARVAAHRERPSRAHGSTRTHGSSVAAVLLSMCSSILLDEHPQRSSAVRCEHSSAPASSAAPPQRPSRFSCGGDADHSASHTGRQSSTESSLARARERVCGRRGPARQYASDEWTSWPPRS